MSASEQEDNRNYTVVKNHEEQYSIYPSDRELPPGWVKAGKENCSKQECLDYINEVWTDMRPLSVREAEKQANGGGSGSKKATSKKTSGKKKAGKKKAGKKKAAGKKGNDSSAGSA